MLQPRWFLFYCGWQTAPTCVIEPIRETCPIIFRSFGFQGSKKGSLFITNGLQLELLKRNGARRKCNKTFALHLEGNRKSVFWSLPILWMFSLTSEHLCKVCSSALQTIGNVLPFLQNPGVQPGTTADGITGTILIRCRLRQWADRHVGSVSLIFLFLFDGATRKQMERRWKRG